MNDYPHWIDFVAWLGLDPVTVWYEYRIYFFIGLAISVALLAAAAYFTLRALADYATQVKYTFTNKFAFYRSMDELDWEQAAALEPYIQDRKFVYAVPAIAMEDVPGFGRGVGILLLTDRTLLYAGMRKDAGKMEEFRIDALRDANIKDGVKYVTLKLFLADRKPVFQMLGISREHGQELFMKMHSFRVALRDAAQNS
jgi:hypothetical protein